jgi:hypothetical protein
MTVANRYALESRTSPRLSAGTAIDGCSDVIEKALGHTIKARGDGLTQGKVILLLPRAKANVAAALYDGSRLDRTNISDSAAAGIRSARRASTAASSCCVSPVSMIGCSGAGGGPSRARRRTRGRANDRQFCSETPRRKMEVKPYYAYIVGNGRRQRVTACGCGFNRSTQRIDEIVQLVSRNSAFSADVR